MEKNYFKGLVWWIIILFILVFFLIALVIYKGFFVDDELSNKNSTTTTTSTTTTLKKETLSDNEIKKYLGYVPFSLLHKDAYEEEKTNINTIDKAALLFSVYHNEELQKVTNNVNNVCANEGCISEIDFNEKLEEMYNVKIDNFDKEYSESDNWMNYETYLILKDGYYFELGYGGSKKKSDASNVSYEINNNELIIEEQVGIIVEHAGDVNVYNGGVSVKSYSFRGEDGTENPNYEQQAEEYVKDNIDDFNIYKHTFKKNSDGNYYWYSTEVVES